MAYMFRPVGQGVLGSGPPWDFSDDFSESCKSVDFLCGRGVPPPYTKPTWGRSSHFKLDLPWTSKPSYGPVHVSQLCYIKC